mmetsp:Transcript_10732/g.33105  ORF Transcript_10732/g.33105 Transcript_10732/m.33105 type:complete len:222 (-) Transcript_10732:517-1182(-)
MASSGSKDIGAAAPLVAKLAPATSRRKKIAFGLALALAAVAGWAVATSSASDRFAATALAESRPFNLVATLQTHANVSALSLDWRNGDESDVGKLAVGDRDYNNANYPSLQIYRTAGQGQPRTGSGQTGIGMIVDDTYTPSDVVDLAWHPNGNTLQLLSTISSSDASDNNSKSKAYANFRKSFPAMGIGPRSGPLTAAKSPFVVPTTPRRTSRSTIKISTL